MKKYALILACLAWAYTSVQGQSAGGGGGAAGGGGAGGGATGGTAAGTGATGGSIGTGTAAQPGGVTSGRSTAPGVQRPLPGVRPVQPGVGSPVNPAVPPGVGVADDTGAIGGTAPGTGATGGIQPGVGGTGGTVTDPLTGAPTGVQTGVNGARGAATPGGTGALGAGTSTAPMTAGTATDLALTQQIRAQLLNGGMAAGTAAGAANTGTAAARARGLGAISPQSLRNVQIHANNGAVTLNGTVNSQAERQLLENRVRRMTGVQTVFNNLTVSSGAGQIGQGTAPGTISGAGTSGVAPAPTPGTRTPIVGPNDAVPSTVPPR